MMKNILVHVMSNLILALCCNSLLRWVPDRGTSIGPEVSDLIVSQLAGFQQGDLAHAI